MNYLAQIQIAPNGGFKGLGTSPLANPANNYVQIFSTVISVAIGVMTLIAFIWFVFTFISGAIAIISSGGDKQAYESARKKITTGIIGVVVVISAIFIVDLLGTIIGIPILNFQVLYSLLVGGSIPSSTTPGGIPGGFKN